MFHKNCMLSALVVVVVLFACTSTDAFVTVPPSYVSRVGTIDIPRPSNIILHAIVDEVSDQMKVAMRAKDTTKLATIRLIRAAFANAQIDAKTDALSDDQAVDVLRKMSKMRKESIDMYTKGGATDRADAEQAELDVLNQWLPQLADEDQTREWVQTAIAEASDNGDVNIGKVMGALMKAHKGEVDGGLAQKVVKEEVSKL